VSNVILSSYHQMTCATKKKIRLRDIKTHWDTVYRFLHCCNFYDNERIATLYYRPKHIKRKSPVEESSNIYFRHSIKKQVSFIMLQSEGCHSALCTRARTLAELWVKWVRLHIIIACACNLFNHNFHLHLNCHQILTIMLGKRY